MSILWEYEMELKVKNIKGKGDYFICKYITLMKNIF